MSIEDLTARLGELDAETESLRITRKTLLNIPAPEPADHPPRSEVPHHPAYQQILAAFTDTGRPTRARDLCEALDLPILPKNTEGIRSKPKRLVTRGILTEPGLPAQPRTWVPVRPADEDPSPNPNRQTDIRSRTGLSREHCTAISGQVPARTPR